ncbi:TrbL/VirB6 family protein [Wolbachia endosymbiont of Chironomus riparius]|uniref:type IV secretion system protein n=1 Tax=Wolbachia endosymbiont of Chironomus riparius TaxID=2883238 RepID=UPI0035199904
MPFPRCISADYFGPDPVTVSARFASENIDAFIPDNKEVIDPKTGEVNYGFHSNQVVKWEDTKLETNGDNLVIRINGAWTSWSHINPKESERDSLDLKKLERLKYADKLEGSSEANSLPDFKLICNDYKSSAGKVSTNSSISCSVSCKYFDQKDDNTPCWFTNGNGAYLLFKRSNDGNPNEELEIMRYPTSPTVHLGYNSVSESGDGVFILKKNSSNIKDSQCNPIKLEKGWKIYIKILDRYYFDNAGGYSLEFLSGVRKSHNGNFFDYVYNYLKCTLLINKTNCSNHDNNNNLAAAQEMFKYIAEKSTSFHNFVTSLLVLFIVISSLLYLFGMIQETKHDLLIRMMKITLVVVLISPESFNFFYNNFLVLFVDGLEYLIKVITNFAPNANTETLFSFMYNMWNKFFADSVFKKFAAFFHYQVWASILMTPVILIGIVLYFLLCLYAFIIFLTGFMGIAFLIAIMPLFLISILFSQLKKLFEGWIKLCISFCLQSVMIFTLLSLLGSMIMTTFYRQLGFTVCYNKWLEVRLCLPKWVFGGFCIIDKEFFHWTPGQVFVPYTIGEASDLKLDQSIEGIDNISRAGGTVKFTGGVGYIPIPPDYISNGFRYIDYPFFDPLSSSDHYIKEDDIVLDKECRDEDLKNLVRLTNTLSHSLEKFDILLLINNIEKKVEELYCKNGNKGNCNNYKKIVDDYKKGILKPSLKSEIKLMTENIIKYKGCSLGGFYSLNSKYQDNSDYQRVQDIKEGYLLNVKEILILFLLSFLIFSLRKLAQEMGSNFAEGGYSVYSISSMYQADPNSSSRSPLASLAEKGKDMYQGIIGGSLQSLGRWTTRLPNRLLGGAANALGRIPGIGGVLKHTINVPRKLINTSIEATKFITSPKNDVNKFEDKIYKAFGVDPQDIAHRKIDRYLDYYKGYMGSHLGYSLKDAMEFCWEHGLNSLEKKSDSKKLNLYTGEISHKDNLLYMSKVYRKDFLQKLHDYTIGTKKSPPIDKEVQRKLGSEELVEKIKGMDSNEIIEKKRAEREVKKNQEDEIYNLESFFGGIEKRTERKEKNQKDEDVDLSLLFNEEKPIERKDASEIMQERQKQDELNDKNNKKNNEGSDE